MDTESKSIEICTRLGLPTSGSAFILIKSALDDSIATQADKIAALEMAIKTYEEQKGMSDRLIAAQAAEIERLNEIAAEMVELRYRANDERISAEATVRIQAAEIERMRIENVELKVVMDQLSGLLSGPITVCKAQRNRIAELNAEIERLRAALQQAEQIRDDMVNNADSIGEMLFGDYADEDPTGNGNDRYWPKEPGMGVEEDDEDVCYSYAKLAKIAGLINEMLDSDWVDTTGERQ